MAKTNYERYMNCSWSEDEIQKAKLADIEYSKGLYEAQVYIAKKEDYLKDLLLEDYVSKIRRLQTRYDVVDIYSKAQGEIGKKLKKDRPHLETIKHFLMDDFLNNDKKLKLEKIICCGYEGYAWRFEFKGYGKTSFIEIPIKRKLTPENIEYVHFGMFAFGVYESEHCYSTMKTSYDIKEVAEFIKGYFEKEE